jgi:hypothetical protein
LAKAKEKIKGMKYRTILLVMVSSLILACDKADQQAVLQPENTLQPSASLPEPATLTGNETATSIKTNQINTQITPDMVKNIRFDAMNDDERPVYSDKPLNLSPAGSTRISVTPKLFLKEELDLKQNYMDNIDGASVQVEMKFD